MTVLSIGIIAGLAATHVVVGRIAILDRWAGTWKSAAGGVGLAYAFLVLLPKLASAQPVLERVSESGLYGFLTHQSYLLALFGLVAYYAADATVERKRDAAQLAEQESGAPVRMSLAVRMHASILAGYYFLMLEGRGNGTAARISLVMFGVAMFLHFLSIDHGLRRKYGSLYDEWVRWVFVVATLGGWIAALVTKIPYEIVALLTSLFAGVLIVVTLREKLPGRESQRLVPLAFGAACYALLLLVIEMVENIDVT